MFSGVVVVGDGIGRTIGYPTANLDISPEETGLADGVYAAWAAVFGKPYRAALVVQRSAQKVEAHLVNFSGGDIYGAALAIEPKQKVSEIEYLDGEALKKKIARDIALVQEALT
jgi:riboflavin kinase/FMN adenylyltransferase